MAPLDEDSFAGTDWYDEFPAEDTARPVTSHEREQHRGGHQRHIERESPPTQAAGRDVGSAVSLLDVMPTLQVVEAVAIVEALCADLLESGTPSVPQDLDASQVLVHADGTVTAPPGDDLDAEAVVATIGRLLSDLMGQNNFLLLRERVVWRALASPPEYRSLEEFLRAVQYYARPNGRELVQAVYARGPQDVQRETVQHGARSVQDGARAEPPKYIEPAFDLSPADTRSPQPQHLHRGIVTAGIALFILTWALVRLHAALAALPPVDAPNMFAIESGIPLPSPLTARWTQSSSALRRSPTMSRGASQLAQGLPVDGAERSNAAAVLLGVKAADRIEDVAAMNPSDTSAESATTVLPAIESANPHVVPPRVLYPQSLNLLPFGSKPSANVLEVLVNEDGLVETARSVYEPSTIGEFTAIMSGLSITKAWRFYPATLDGRPVKYRLLISLTK
jgi:hypothetical protein